MPTSWLSTWRSLACKTQANEVHDPKAHIYHHHVHPHYNNNYSGSGSADQTSSSGRAAEISTMGGGGVLGGSKRALQIVGGQRSGCSRSIANLRDVIHSSRRIEAGLNSSAGGVGGATNFSPKSVESNDFVQSISHEAMLKSHSSEHVHPILKANGHDKLSLDDIVANYYPLQSSGKGSFTGHGNAHKAAGSGHNHGNGFYGTPLHPTTAAAAAAASSHHTSGSHQNYSGSGTKSSCGVGGNSLMKLSGCYDCKNPAVSLVVYRAGGSTAGSTAGGSAGHGGSAQSAAGNGSLAAALTTPVCRRCGEVFPRYEALEKHHLLKHLVTELGVGDSSRNVVEIIFRTSWLKTASSTTEGRSSGRAMMMMMAAAAAAEDDGSGGSSGGRGGWVKIDKVFKVNNLARTVARFEAYREGVKSKASRLPKKHPRCLADGNELLRFYAAKLECNLAAGNAAAAACSSASCTVCRIIRGGFSKSRGLDGSNCGILTTATSGRAHDILLQQHRKPISHNTSFSNSLPAAAPPAMAMLVCRVIAGRIHKPPPPDSAGCAAVDTSAFDSVAGGDAGAGAVAEAAGLQSRFEELTVFTPRAILPCFVVLYATTAAAGS